MYKKKGVGCTKKGGLVYELGGRVYGARGGGGGGGGEGVGGGGGGWGGWGVECRVVGGVGCTWITLCFNSFFTGLFTLSIT